MRHVSNHVCFSMQMWNEPYVNQVPERPGEPLNLKLRLAVLTLAGASSAADAIAGFALIELGFDFHTGAFVLERSHDVTCRSIKIQDTLVELDEDDELKMTDLRDPLKPVNQDLVNDHLEWSERHRLWVLIRRPYVSQITCLLVGLQLLQCEVDPIARHARR